MSSYQSFVDRPGVSRSSEKLDRIKLPADLTGMSVLDLGCNEGFFSLEAKRRGAEIVIGLDHDEKLLASARKLAEVQRLNVAFVHGDMKTLPDRKFDFVLLLSALHYIDEPAQLLRTVRDVLTPSGVLILETGLAAGKGGKTVSRALRSIDERFFPTRDLLKQVWLRDYSAREMGHSVAQIGDPLPRYVFHCSPIKTNVLFIVGAGGIGKSSLAAQFTNSPVISTDELFAPDRFAQPKLHPTQKRYDEVFSETKSIWATWERINGEGEVRDYFASVTATAIKHCAGAGSVVVEGFVLRNIIDEIKAKLGPDYQCWSTGRV